MTNLSLLSISLAIFCFSLPPQASASSSYPSFNLTGKPTYFLTVPMDAMKGQGGIQMLLTAEQEAQEIVSSARNLKMKRLKQAKEEAEREVTLYRSNLEVEHQKNVSETTGYSGSNVKRLEEETNTKIESLKQRCSKASPDVVGVLLKCVTTVRT